MLDCLQRCAPITFCLDTDWIYIARRFASAGQPIGTVRAHHVRTHRSTRAVQNKQCDSRQRGAGGRDACPVLFPAFVPPEQHETTLNGGDEAISNHAPCPRPCRTWWHRKGKWSCNTICCRFQPRHRTTIRRARRHYHSKQTQTRAAVDRTPVVISSLYWISCCPHPRCTAAADPEIPA